MLITELPGTVMGTMYAPQMATTASLIPQALRSDVAHFSIKPWSPCLHLFYPDVHSVTPQHL
jgi:hypothetical protein